MAQIRYTRNLFLRGMSIIYLFAFTSLYVQIPGLYGNNGVLPARIQLDSKAKTLSGRIHTKPTLLWLAPYIGLDTEYMMDVLALLGIFLAFTGFVSQKFCTAPSFAGLWSLYYSLYQVGETFMKFQWDILLLEAGFLSILVAPLRYQSQSKRRAVTAALSDGIPFWLVRWLLFRLMFQSGVVKLTSGCPTWWGLTATAIHFESQCIPTSLAWYVHHLPRWLLKLATVFTFVIEIELPHLFFFPVRSVRIITFFLQVLFQIAIILTGNYNFFNLITIVLCISLLDDEFFYRRRLQRGRTSAWSGMINKVVNALVYGGILYTTIAMFSVRLTPSHIESDVAFTKQEFDWLLSFLVPGSVYLGLSALVPILTEALAVSITDIPGTFAKISAILTTLFYTIVAVFIFGISIVPYSTLHPAGNSTVVPALRHWHSRLDHLHLTNAYGLFRRMTGIGGRPEVILEGSNHIDGPWLEYNFLYKPGNVNSTPPFVAPHQPRLDWQMWFASLSPYHQNPWILSLTYRLLQGQPEVLHLLDTSRNPFSNKPPKYIRASLYHYHFSPWSQRWSDPWWTREKVSEYFPIFSRDHPPLLDFLRHMKVLSGASEREDSVSGSQVAPWLKMLLDRLRYLVSHVEPSLLLWSVFSAGCAIITTSGTTSHAATRR